MLENKRTYRWFAACVLTGGLLVFLISLITAMSGERMQIHEQRALYFDRTILPDHVFYPVVVAMDRLELELADRDEQLELRLDLADKRLTAAQLLLAKGKRDLAFITLGKAHQYLLAANSDVAQVADPDQYVSFVVEMDERFAEEYEQLRSQLTDAQQATLTGMQRELASRRGQWL